MYKQCKENHTEYKARCKGEKIMRRVGARLLLGDCLRMVHTWKATCLVMVHCPSLSLSLIPFTRGGWREGVNQCVLTFRDLYHVLSLCICYPLVRVCGGPLRLGGIVIS